MPFKAKPFTDAGYHQERLKTMSWLDKLASYLLAVNWSEGQGGAAGRPKTRVNVGNKRVMDRQFDSHLDCVAVASIGDKFYIAANTLDITSSNILVVDQSIGQTQPIDVASITSNNAGGNANMVVTVGQNHNNFVYSNYAIVKDGGALMHAEMRIVANAKANNRLEAGTVIGVSKPCCPRCTAILEKIGWAYTSYHDVPVPADRWENPNV